MASRNGLDNPMQFGQGGSGVMSDPDEANRIERAKSDATSPDAGSWARLVRDPHTPSLQPPPVAQSASHFAPPGSIASDMVGMGSPTFTPQAKPTGIGPIATASPAAPSAPSAPSAVNPAAQAPEPVVGPPQPIVQGVIGRRDASGKPLNPVPFNRMKPLSVQEGIDKGIVMPPQRPDLSNINVETPGQIALVNALRAGRDRAMEMHSAAADQMGQEMHYSQYLDNMGQRMAKNPYLRKMSPKELQSLQGKWADVYEKAKFNAMSPRQQEAEMARRTKIATESGNAFKLQSPEYLMQEQAGKTAVDVAGKTAEGVAGKGAPEAEARRVANEEAQKTRITNAIGDQIKSLYEQLYKSEGTNAYGDIKLRIQTLEKQHNKLLGIDQDVEQPSPAQGQPQFTPQALALKADAQKRFPNDIAKQKDYVRQQLAQVK